MAPLTPEDCDLRGLPFMPLDVSRLRDSDLAIETTGDEFKAAVLLWCASWTQVPAASLPYNERSLMKFAGLTERAWKRARAGALRGWVRCSDGRLYHPVVAEKALEAWDRRGDWEEKQEHRTTRQQRWRDRCKALAGQLRDAGVDVPAGASLSALEALVETIQVDDRVDVSASTGASTASSTVDAREMPLTGTGTGTGTKETPGGVARATRLPPDWIPSDIDRAYAAKQGFSQASVERIIEKFRNYWIAKSGKASTKLDWPATWRNWVLEEAERRGVNPGRQPQVEWQ